MILVVRDNRGNKRTITKIFTTIETFDFKLKFIGKSRAVFTSLSKGIGFGFGFTTPFGWLVYLLWFRFYDSQVKTALMSEFYVN